MNALWSVRQLALPDAAPTVWVAAWSRHHQGAWSITPAQCGLDDEADLARFHASNNPHYRRRLLLGRYLLRHALAAEYGGAPAQWRIASDGAGRPTACSNALGRVHVGLGHAARLSACVLSNTAPVGIDVEHAYADADFDHLIPRVCAPDECRALGQLSPRRRRARFLQHWTLKEASLKACGLTFSDQHADLFAFSLPLRRQRVRHFAQQGGRWWQFGLMNRYIVAIAQTPLTDTEQRHEKFA